MRKVVLIFLLAFGVKADVVEFQNGDRLHGKVLTLSETELKLRNDIQGVITLPREQIVRIELGIAKIGAAAAPKTPNPGDILKRLEGNDETGRAVQQVQNEFLAGASPEAQRMFQEMAGGVLSGKLQIGDIRAQAQSALTDLREMQRDLGDDDTTALLGSYAAILENFLRSTPVGTNAPARPLVPQTAPQQEN